MNVEKLYDVFNEKWGSFREKEKLERYRFLTSLINRVNTSNPHYLRQLPRHYFYNLIKEKFDIFMNGLGFECRKCEESCCYFSELEFIIKEIGIYKEDYELLEDNNGDLNGYVIAKNPNEYNLIKTLIEDDVEISEFVKFKEKVMGLLGYVKNLNIIEKNGRLQCYYYDEINRKCKIHENKPIVCYTFPIRITNSWDKVGLQFCEDCNYIKTMIKEYSYEGYYNQCNEMKSFWEYNIAVILFLKYKNRTEVKDGILSDKKPEKYAFTFNKFVNKFSEKYDTFMELCNKKP